MTAAIRRHLALKGRITFSEFMRLALYDEREGYYASAREKFGIGGDFYTAGQVHEMFGALLADEFAAVWQTLGWPGDFAVVELGAGRGEFAHDALAALRAKHSGCYEALRYVICEVSGPLRHKQQARLAAFAPRVAWVNDLGELRAPVQGVFFSNEFFDALPVHLVRQRGGQLRELYVELDADDRLRFCEGELSGDAIADYWRRVGVPLEDGQRAEVNLEAVKWIGQIAQTLALGRVITIDYGETAERLYTPDRPEGTLRCFHHHRLNNQPFERIGEQDLTASVNFTALMEYGRDAGLETKAFTRQTDYLIRLGLLERAAELAGRAEGESPQALQHRLALKHLFVPQGIAAYFKVLVQEK